MEEKDFDPKIIEEADLYASIIIGGLGHEWDVPLWFIKKSLEKDREWLIGQLIFFLVKCREIDKSKQPYRDLLESCQNE